MSLKQWFRAFLMGAALIWLLEKLHTAYLTGRIRGRHRTYSVEKDPLSFDVMVAFDIVFILIIVGTIVSMLIRAAKR